MFEDAKRIWGKEQPADDEYFDFLIAFDAKEKEDVRLAVTCDGQYCLRKGDRLIAFGQYGDYRDFKVYDELSLRDSLNEGRNEYVLTVWHFGVASFTYINKGAGAKFEVRSGGRLLAASGGATPCRRTPGFIPYRCESITGQVGLSFAFDACDKGGDWGDSVVLPEVWENDTPRPIEKLVLCDRSPSVCVKAGGFVYPDPAEKPAKAMSTAVLREAPCSAAESFTVNAAEGESGCFFIVDLGCESAGMPDVDFDVDGECDIDIGWGEHLIDGRCRTAIRNFACRLHAKKGRNTFLFPMIRFGCRYLQAFVHAPKIGVRYFGLRQTLYPVTICPSPVANDPIRQKIYEVCINTLRQCMHEHYEDCPWREQSLYTLDSRNQMLCGYYAFGETRFPRASLDLISHGMREDGLLAICYPAGWDLPIPSFGLVYFLQMREYLDHSGDTAFLAEKYPLLLRLLSTYWDREKEDGLIFRFYEKKEYWNFYEWSDGMTGPKDQSRSVEAPLNAYLSLALQNLAVICLYLGKDDDAERYGQIAKSVNYAIAKEFYNKQTSLFNSFDDRAENDYSVLTNSLCLLCGAADNVDRGRILEILEKNGGSYEGIRIIPNTLSMNSFRFDALLKVDFEKYRKVILDELDRDYLYMLRNGATSFWETIVGDFDFGYAGSLCHGWSALPIYYYEILNG